MADEYRKEADYIAKQTTWTIKRFLWPFLLLVVIGVPLGWFLKSAGIIGMDIEREVVQHSRFYTESKQAKLQNLFTQYQGLNVKLAEAKAGGFTEVGQAVSAQKKAIVAQMRREVTNIPASELPENIRRLVQY